MSIEAGARFSWEQIASRRTVKIKQLFRSVRKVLAIVAATATAAGLTGVAIVAATSAPASADGVAFQTGDLLAGQTDGTIRHYNSSGQLLDTLTSVSSSSEETGMCFDQPGNLYATNWEASSMTKFGPNGNVLTSPWGGPFNTHPESCVVDANANVYVGSVDSGALQKYDESGNLLATFQPQVEDRGIDWIDLASDQCTVYYTSEGSGVHVFDVCANQQRPDFATGLPSPCYALRIRQNGEILVACSSEVVRLSPTGSVIQTYPDSSLPGASYLFAMNLDPDGTSFWTADFYNGNVYKVDIATGAVLEQFNAGSSGVRGLALVGGSGPVGGGLTPVESIYPNNPSEDWQDCTQGHYPVDCMNGAFVHAFSDFAIPGRGVALNLTRSYDSLAASTEGMFGYGWSSSYGMHLSVDPNTGNVTVYQENGSAVTFAPSGSGYTAPPRVLATLVKNADGSFTMTRKAQTRFNFASAGQLTSESDLNGYTTTLAYNGSGQLATVTDPAGRALSFSYGSNELVSKITDPAGRAVSYGYDSSGNLTSVTDVAGNVWQFGYDSNHLMTTMTDPRSGVVTNVYDSSGRVTSQTDPMNRKTTYSYAGSNLSSTGGSTTITDPNGNVEVQNYQNGELTSLTKGSGTSSTATWTYTYDQYTLETASITDPNGHVSTYQYDSQGDQTSVRDPLGRTTTATYNSLDEPTAVTDPAGTTTSYTYDPSGNPTGMSRPLTGTNQVQQIIVTYGDSSHPGDVTSVTDPDGKVWSYTYDTYGDQASSTDPLGNETTYAYDNVGRLTSEVAPKGNVSGGNPSAYTTSYVTDAYGDVTKVTDPLGHFTSNAYDGDRNISTSADADGNTTSYTYDADNELTKVTRSDGTTLQYSYDGDGNQTGQTDGNNNTTGYGYDPLNRVISTTDPLSHKTSYTYDGAGNRLTMVDPAGQTTTWSYDAANEISAISYSDGKTPNVTNISYNPDGQRTAMTDGTGTSTWAYDSLNRLTSYTNGAGSKVSYGYDLKGQETSITYPGSTGTVNRSYDAAGDLISLTDPAGNTTGFGYDPNLNNTAETFPSSTGITDTFGYNNADQLTGITDSKSGSTFASFTYGLDPNAQVTSVASTGVPSDNHSYGYDQLNRLTNVDTSTYAYDNGDNLTKLISGATQNFNAADELTSSTNGTFTYDSRGNRTQGPATLGGSATYGYDQANRLASASVTKGAPTGSLAGGEDHSVAVKSDGTVWASGINNYGQLGNGTTTNSTSPVQVKNLTGVTQISAGGDQSIALKSDGTVWDWGLNNYGELGNGTTTNSSTPVEVSNLTGATAVSEGFYFGLALKSDGTVWAWGDNNYGQLGNGTTTNSTTPVQVKNLTGTVAISAGYYQSYALKSDGTVWAWGLNNYGQLGNGTTTTSTTPVQVSGLTGVTSIAAGYYHGLAVKSDGSIWSWGLDQYGQLGNGTTTSSTTPVQVKNLTGITAVAAGAYHSYALRSDGTEWSWGWNTYGQLGTGNTTNSSVPVQISGLTGVTSIGSGRYFGLALTSAGTVWGWGYNYYGELGDGGTTGRNSGQLSPTQSQYSGIQGGSTNTATYTYDGDGLQASTTVGGATTPFTWDESASTPVLLSDGTNTYIYGPGNLPVEEITPSGTYYYHHDQLGSSRVLTDSNGNVVATYTYDPYGNTTATTGTANNPLKFAGAYTDSVTGLLYLVNRYYDPATGQFLNVDPLANLTQQPYQYGDDNPLNATDPNGLVSTATPGDGAGCPILASTAIPSRQECVDLINYLDSLLGKGHNPQRRTQWQQVYQANKQLLSKCRKLYGLTPKRPQGRPHGILPWTLPKFLEPPPPEPPSWWPKWLPEPVEAP